MTVVEKVIQYMEECKNQNITIDTNTVYKGFDLGKRIQVVRWQIENEVISITPEQREKLEQLGLFEKKKLRSLDDNIDIAIQWRKDFPDMLIKVYLNDEDIKSHANSPEEVEEFKRRHREAKIAYDYIKRRSNAGKVSKEQLDRCKENYVGIIFGYPSAFEKAAKKYGLSVEKIEYITKKYYKTIEEQTDPSCVEKAIDSFLQDYLRGNLSKKEQKMFKQNLLNVMEVEQGDETYRNFIKSIADDLGDKDNKFYFYSVKGLKSVFKYMPQRPKEAVSYIKDDFLRENKKCVSETRKEKLKVSNQRTHQLIDYVRKRTIKNLAVTIPLIIDFTQKNEDVKENEMTEKLFNALVSNRAVLIPDEGKKPTFKRNYKSLEKYIKPLYEESQKRRIRDKGTLTQRINNNLITEQELRELDINLLGLTGMLETRLKRSGVRTIGDLIDLTPEDMEAIPLTKRFVFSLRSTFNMLGIARTSKEISEEVGDKDLNALKIYSRGNNSLRQNNITSISDITGLTIDEFTEKIGPEKLYIKLIDELNRLGLRFKYEKPPIMYVGRYNCRKREKQKCEEKDRD